MKTVVVAVEGTERTHPVDSSAFRTWLRVNYMGEHASLPGSQALADTVAMLASEAEFRGKEEPVFLRIGEHEGSVYLDLCHDRHESVAIDRDGWRIVSDPPVRFWRKKSMRPLPTPEQGGSIDELIDIVTELDWLQDESELTWPTIESIQAQAPEAYWEADPESTVHISLASAQWDLALGQPA